MKNWMKIVVGVVLAGAVAVLLFYKLAYDRQPPDFENMKAADSITAGALYQSYKTDRDDATTKYNGRVLVLTGILTRVETADSLVVAVFAFSYGDFGDQGVRCTMLKKFNEEASKLQPDGEVKIKGYCTGFNETDVILERCSIIIQ